MTFAPQDDQSEEGVLGDELPEDNATPYSPPATPPDDSNDSSSQVTQTPTLDDTHPVTDTNVEGEEIYDQGLPGAAEAAEPNAGNAVTDYNPEQDQRNQGEA